LRYNNSFKEKASFNQMKKILLFLGLVLLISSLIIAANCPPSLPKTYSGQVSFGDDILSGNYEIRAVIGSDTVGITDVSTGNYEIDISPCFGETGIVKFYINGIGTNEDGNYNGEDDWGINENLDLTVNEMPPGSLTCGDDAIQLGEECDGNNLAGRDVGDCGDGWEGTISCSSTCQIDYSACVVETPTETNPPSSPGGGGGGGGGSSGGSSSSTPTLPNDDGVIVLDENEEDKIQNLEKETEEQNVGTGLGAVIGFVKSNRGIGLISGLVVLVLAGIVLFARKGK
jgi:hypothetical protein